MKAIITVEINEEGLSKEIKKKVLIDLLYNDCYDWVNMDKPPKVQFFYDESDENIDEDLDGLIE
tara:strand:+ start:873 stop:1064 length:192 start_codon:yes stop_codon:yes gene_type:complete